MPETTAPMPARERSPERVRDAAAVGRATREREDEERALARLERQDAADAAALERHAEASLDAAIDAQVTDELDHFQEACERVRARPGRLPTRRIGSLHSGVDGDPGAERITVEYACGHQYTVTCARSMTGRLASMLPLACPDRSHQDQHQEQSS